MLILFPLIYISSFIFALKGIITGNRQSALLFLLFGLPIYISTLSITFSMGFGGVIGFLQVFKELLIFLLLSSQLINLKTRFKYHWLDYLVIAYFLYLFLYAVLPVGGQAFANRLVAFKSISFFPLIYFSGRLLSLKEVYLAKYFQYILYLTLAAAAVALAEFSFYQHFQTITGYADYHYYFYNFNATGSYGLTYTFEAEAGIKRFASFFANPLEHAAATLLALSVIAAIYTSDNYRFKPDAFGWIVLVATQISIFLALSRSSLLSYFLIIYVYALITRKRLLLNFIHALMILAVLYFLFLLNDEDVQDFVISTLNFTNPSSAGHVLEWVEGINAMIQNPLGLGLGASGRVAGSLGDNTGGENQFIIIGVQAGIVAMGLYMLMYAALVKLSYKWFYHLKGKEKQLCLVLLLIKIGFLVPFLTSELETSPYISYISWFFSGLFITVISARYLPAKLTASANNTP